MMGCLPSCKRSSSACVRVCVTINNNNNSKNLNIFLATLRQTSQSPAQSVPTTSALSMIEEPTAALGHNISEEEEL